MNTNAPSVIVVILSYGIWDTTKRSPKEIVGYGMYLKNCAEAIFSLLMNHFDPIIIICGGAKNEENKIEAQTLRFYFWIKSLQIFGVGWTSSIMSSLKAKA